MLASTLFLKRIPLLLTILLSPIWAPLLYWAGQNNHAYASTPGMTGLHVAGNKILNGSNQVVQLRGVDRSGTEYACIQGWGIFDGPSDATSVQAIASWHVNAVRIPLNEDCWLNINGVNSAYGGSNYQNAIVNYVNLLNSYGIAAIVELHWDAPGSAQATGQQPMPDQDHAPAFWTSVANTFKANSSVIFDLFNEPYPDNNQNTTAAWQCLLNGGSCSGVSYQTAGMQELVNTVRSTGATNIIMTGGVQYAGSLTQWLQYKPSDPTGNLAASWHNYNFTQCTDSTCWNSVVAPVAQQVPLIVGEIGENDCAHGYIDGLMPWLDAHSISYLAWAWDTASCSSFPSLISNYNGTPTNFGVSYQQHLASLFNSNPTPVPTSTSPTATNTPATPTSTPAPTATSVPMNVTVSGTSASPSTIAPGGTQTFHTTVTSNRTLSNALIDFEVYNSAGTKVYQTYQSPVTLAANTPQTYQATWSIPSTQAAGTYTLDIGVFDSTWTTNYAWNGSGATLTVGTTSATNTPVPPTATATSTATPTSTPAPPTATRTVQPSPTATKTVPSPTATKTATAPTATPLPSKTATATATAAPLSVKVTGRVSAATVATGGTEKLTAQVTSSKNINSALIDFEVYGQDSSGSWQKICQPIATKSLQAGIAATVSRSCTIPAGAQPGSYVLKIGIFGPNWSAQYAWNDAAASFQVK